MRLSISAALRGATASVALVALTLSTASIAAENPQVAAEVMKLARDQWAAEIAGQSAQQQMATVADEYTEFNPLYPTRIDGKAMATAMLAVPPPDRTIFADMQNPKVQVYGDTAILTYNFAGITRDKNGKLEPVTAKSTRVYHRQNGRWMLVHANFAPVGATD